MYKPKNTNERMVLNNIKSKLANRKLKIDLLDVKKDGRTHYEIDIFDEVSSVKPDILMNGQVLPELMVPHALTSILGALELAEYMTRPTFSVVKGAARKKRAKVTLDRVLESV